MGLVIVIPSPPCRSLVSPATAARKRAPLPPILRRHLITVRRLRPSLLSDTNLVCRSDNFASKCCITNIEVDNNITNNKYNLGDLPSLPSGCSIPVVHNSGDVIASTSSNLLTERTSQDSVFEELPVLSEGEQHTLAATAAHPAGLYAMYVSYLFGNLVEQLWNFAWPAALAFLHPSLLPVAVVGFFTRLSVFIGAPIVGRFMDHFPRVPIYNSLNIVQAATQLLSAAMIIYALSKVSHNSASSVLIQPWFIVLVVASGIERLAGLALGVAMERDWVVLLAGANRPVALAEANAVLNRVDLLCETAGASIFGILLSKFDPVTCLKLACGLMIVSLPILVMLGQIINRFSCGVLDSYRIPHYRSFTNDLLDAGKLVENGLGAIRQGWKEYKDQTVLPASMAYVLLNFNIALAPGAIMTALLMHHGTSPSIIGGFTGLCSIMGFVATFISSSLVKRIGILKAGAAGLIFQALLLSVAVVVYWTGSLSRQMPLLLFLTLIVSSRLGHMSYDIVGTQILQTGIPASKANLIGTTEVSIASFAELLMLGVAIIANDISHFGALATLSLFSVVIAAWMFCLWLANPTNKQRSLFMFNPLTIT